MVDSALKQLTALPEEYQRFYRWRMIAQIEKTLAKGN